MEAVSILELLGSPDTAYQKLQSCTLQIGYGNSQVIHASIESIRTILSDTVYKIDSKLRTVQYLRDCFLQANKQFVIETENEILPLMRKILEDRLNQRSYSDYALRSYKTLQEMKQFKCQLMSLFQLVQECIISWSVWAQECKMGNSGFVQLFQRMKEERLLSQTKNIYLKEGDKDIFSKNWKSQNRTPPCQISKIMARVDNLVELPKEMAKKQIIILTNDLERVGNMLSSAVRESVQKQFQTRLSRISIRNNNKKAIDEVNQIESEHQLTYIEQSQNDQSYQSKCYQLQVDSFVNPNIGTKDQKQSIMKQSFQSQNSYMSVVQQKRTPKPSKYKPSQTQNKENVTFSTSPPPQSTLLQLKLSQISLWYQILKAKLSPANITNFKLSLLKQSKLLYSDNKVLVYFTLQNLSEQHQVYKLRLQYKLLSQYSTFEWIDNTTIQQQIDPHPPAQFTTVEYKQLIIIKSHPSPHLKFWRIKVDNNTIEFPLPFTTLNILLKGLVSKQRTNSCLGSKQIFSPSIHINRSLASNARQITKYFPTGIKGTEAKDTNNSKFCLLHEHSNTMLVLTIQYLDKGQIRFKINLVESNQDSIAHSLLECLLFVFQDKEQR